MQDRHPTHFVVSIRVALLFVVFIAVVAVLMVVSFPR
jgi:hypothetical protein